MKIALLTFINTNNYGAMLQGYATTRFLEQHGHEVTIINVPLLNPGEEKKYNIIIRIFKKTFSLLDRINRFLNKQKKISFLEKRRIYVDKELMDNAKIYDKKNMHYFDEFRKIYLKNITNKEYYFKDDFQSDFSFIDLFIVGSDQVWNPWVTNTQFDIFFFSFLKDGQKRISLAPSFGGSKKWYYPKKLTKQIKVLLSKFDDISVRDGDSNFILENKFKIKGVEVLDPTFLLDNYNELLQDCSLNATGSIFIFKFIINEYWVDAIKFISKELQLDVRMDSCLIPFDGVPFKPECTVLEWLALIKTSNFVFTDSFHGMVFCILFRKQFIVTPSYANGEGRYIDLAEKLGLEDRLYYTTKQIYEKKDIWIKRIDYEKVYNKIEILKKDSREYLLSHLI